MRGVRVHDFGDDVCETSTIYLPWRDETSMLTESQCAQVARGTSPLPRPDSRLQRPGYEDNSIRPNIREATRVTPQTMRESRRRHLCGAAIQTGLRLQHDHRKQLLYQLEVGSGLCLLLQKLTC